MPGGGCLKSFASKTSRVSSPFKIVIYQPLNYGFYASSFVDRVAAMDNFGSSDEAVR